MMDTIFLRGDTQRHLAKRKIDEAPADYVVVITDAIWRNKFLVMGAV